MRIAARVFFTLAFLGFVVGIHEVGHGVAMVGRGIEVEKVCVGIDVSFLPSISFALDRYPGTAFKIAPLLFGGYTKPRAGEMDRLKTLPMSVQMDVLAAGVRWNMIGATFFTLILILFWRKSPIWEFEVFRLLVFATGGMTLFLLLWPTAFNYAMPFVGALFFLYILKNLGFETLSGPVGAVRSTYSAQGLLPFPFIGFALFFSVGACNMIPLPPLDGGRIVVAWVHQFSPGVATACEQIGLFLFLAGFIFLTVQDLLFRRSQR